jgi:hypothetical protein
MGHAQPVQAEQVQGAARVSERRATGCHDTDRGQWHARSEVFRQLLSNDSTIGGDLELVLESRRIGQQEARPSEQHGGGQADEHVAANRVALCVAQQLGDLKAHQGTKQRYERLEHAPSDEMVPTFDQWQRDTHD